MRHLRGGLNRSDSEAGISVADGSPCRLGNHPYHVADTFDPVVFQKRLQIVGVGYRATLSGKDLTLDLGFSHKVNVAPPENVQFEVPSPTQIVVNGIDKQVVGEIAAEIRSFRPPEPYKGKGVRYEGEQIRRKAGKAAASAAS